MSFFTSGPFASFSNTLENLFVRNPGQQTSGDVTGISSTNKIVDETGRSSVVIDENANTVIKDGYRDGEEGLIEIPMGDFGSITVPQWTSISRKIDTISDDITGNLASIRYVNSSTLGDLDAEVIPPSSKFFLESVVMGSTEKYQMIETFGQYYAFFYGQRPSIFSFSGQLLNTQNYNWRLEFQHYYQKYWRGTQSVRNGALIALTFSYEIVYGYILNIQTSLTAMNDLSAPFSFQFLVTDIKPIPQMREFQYELKPTDESSVVLLDEDAYKAALDYHEGKTAAVKAKQTKSKNKVTKPGQQTIPSPGSINEFSKIYKDVSVSFPLNPTDSQKRAIAQIDGLEGNSRGSPTTEHLVLREP